MSGYEIDKLVQKTRRKANEIGADTNLDEDIAESELLYTKLNGGTYCMKIGSQRIDHSQYIKALAKDLKGNHRLSLAEVYNHDNFNMFLDIDHKVWEIPTRSEFVMQQKKYKAPFLYTEQFILDMTKEAMHCIARTCLNPNDIVAYVTTTTDEDGNFQVFEQDKMVCPFCNAEMGSRQAVEKCRECRAVFKFDPTIKRYYAGGSTAECAKKAPETAIPYKRKKYHLGFHIRFKNMRVSCETPTVRWLVSFFKKHLRSWAHETSKYQLPKHFFEDSIDESPYGKGKSLRVVMTGKFDKCFSCRGKGEIHSSRCTNCNNGRKFVDKKYHLLAKCVFVLKNTPHLDALSKHTFKDLQRLREKMMKKPENSKPKRVSSDSESNESDTESDDDDEPDWNRLHQLSWEDRTKYFSRLSEEEREQYNDLKECEGSLRAEALVPTFQPLSKQLLKPTHRSDIREVLYLTSIRLVNANVKIIEVDEFNNTYILPTYEHPEDSNVRKQL